MFVATHVHHKGRAYAKIGEARMEMPHNKVWIPCVIYEDADGAVYVRAKDQFERKFTPIKDSA